MHLVIKQQTHKKWESDITRSQLLLSGTLSMWIDFKLLDLGSDIASSSTIKCPSFVANGAVWSYSGLLIKYHIDPVQYI